MVLDYWSLICANISIIKICNARSGRQSWIWGRAVAGRAKVVTRCGWLERWEWDEFLVGVFLKVSNVFDFLIAADNSFQIVEAEKLKERLLKLVVKKGLKE